MGQMHELDIEVDTAGFLRLSTLERTTKHLGNMVSPPLLEEAAQLGITIDDLTAYEIEAPRTGMWSKLLRLKPIHRILMALYNRLFWILSQQTGDWLKSGDPKSE